MTITQHTEAPRLSRNEADIVVRQLAGEYHNQYGLDNTERLDDFARKLSWQVGAAVTTGHLADVLTAIDNLMDIYWGDQPHECRDQYESDLNMAVNAALDAAGVNGCWILRAGEQRPWATAA